MNILNNSVERANVFHSHITWDDAYSTDEIELLNSYCSNLETKKGTAGWLEKVDDSVRISDISFVRYNDKASDDIKWFFHKTNNLIQFMNEKYYEFNLNGYDYFQYTEYDSNKKSKYDYHLDMLFGWPSDPNSYAERQRKLSYSLCLSDPSEYEGGKFLINMGKNSEAVEVVQKKGRVILFPSFMMHRVSEVTSGKRKSIVIWTTGPKFK